MDADIEIFRNRKSNEEGPLRLAWLLKHRHASSIVFDEKTGCPHQAIYEYPMSTLAHEQYWAAFWAEVERLSSEERTHDNQD